MTQLKSDLKQISNRLDIMQTKKCLDSINRIKNILVENFISDLSSEMQNKSNALDCKVKEYEKNLLDMKDSESCRCYCEAFKREFGTENEKFLLDLIETTNDEKIKSILCKGISYIQNIDFSNEICLEHFKVGKYTNKHIDIQSYFFNEIEYDERYKKAINQMRTECDNNEKYRLDCEKIRSICDNDEIAKILCESEFYPMFDIEREQLAILIQELEAQKRCGDEISHFIDGFMKKIERVKGLNNEKDSF